jgi:hypothetical protein
VPCRAGGPRLTRVLALHDEHESDAMFHTRCATSP